MQTSKFIPYGSRTCIIQIYSYEGRNPRGILQNKEMERAVAFENLTQLLLAMDSLFDELGTPQRSMEPRSFGGVRSAAQPDVGGFSGKPAATFKVEVLFRQNASWQGTAVWLDKNEEAQFRSALELILLLDSVFSEK